MDIEDNIKYKLIILILSKGIIVIYYFTYETEINFVYKKKNINQFAIESNFYKNKIRIINMKYIYVKTNTMCVEICDN